MASSAASSDRDDRRRAVAVAALLAGALAIATSALFVKVSEAGPVATAFWRVALALPFLWAWALIEQRGALIAAFTTHRGLILAVGFFFAGDLAFWHWSIVLTSVANATLLANLAPIFVTLATWLLSSRRPTTLFALGLVTALAGVALTARVSVCVCAPASSVACRWYVSPIVKP